MALVGLLPSQQVRLALLSREVNPIDHPEHIPMPRCLLLSVPAALQDPVFCAFWHECVQWCLGERGNVLLSCVLGGD